MKNNRILPIGLKGGQINERMMELMGINQINESKSNIAVELTKMGPDGKAYAIIRENHEYYIKSTNKTSGLIAEDFKYIGGLQNKKQEAYPSYAKAIKHLNIKFNSIQEALDTRIDINVFEDDNLLNEDIAGFSNAYGGGFSGAGNLEGNTALYEEEELDGEEIPENPEDYTKQPGYIHEEDEDMSDEEKAIDEMLEKSYMEEDEKVVGDYNHNGVRDKQDFYIEGGKDDSEKETNESWMEEGNFKKRLKTGIKKVGNYINKKLEPMIDRGAEGIKDAGIGHPFGDTKPFGENYMEENDLEPTQQSQMSDEEIEEMIFNMTGEELVQFLKDAGQDIKNKFMSMISTGAGKLKSTLNRMYPENQSIYEGKLSISRAIDKMDSIIDSLTETDLKKKV